MTEAWKIYRREAKFGFTFGKCLAIAWRNAKTRIQNEEVRRTNEANFKAVQATKVFNYTHVGRTSLYANGVYSGD